MIVENDLGGINETDNPALQRAKQADLVTLPEHVEGTNCYNCKWVTANKSNKSMCTNEKVRQYVNERMCCALWDAKGVYRPFKQDEKYK